MEIEYWACCKREVLVNGADEAAEADAFLLLSKGSLMSFPRTRRNASFCASTSLCKFATRPAKATIVSCWLLMASSNSKVEFAFSLFVFLSFKYLAL